MNSSHSANHPGSRWGHIFIYDPIRDEVLLFGGARERGSFLGDTWTWSEGSWKYHNVKCPHPRGFAASSFHTSRGSVILHGGRGDEGITYSDTWEWDGSNWNKLEANSPYQSDHHQMVYVDHDDEIMAFGGWDGQAVSEDTWIWNGGWTNAKTKGPNKRAAYAMTYDSQEKKVYLFGGLWVHGQYADLWYWQDQSWKQLGGPYDNSSVDHLAMTYDAKHKKVIMFGGKNYRYVLQGSTLAIDTNMLLNLEAKGPTPRHSLGLTFDSNRNQIILYGGKEYQGEEQVALSDLWNWDGKQWRQDTSAIE